VAVVPRAFVINDSPTPFVFHDVEWHLVLLYTNKIFLINRNYEVG
jgi:hypothetical protein